MEFWGVSHCQLCSQLLLNGGLQLCLMDWSGGTSASTRGTIHEVLQRLNLSVECVQRVQVLPDSRLESQRRFLQTPFEKS